MMPFDALSERQNNLAFFDRLYWKNQDDRLKGPNKATLVNSFFYNVISKLVLSKKS